MATETSIIKRARKQASRPQLFAPLSELEMAQEHASTDCLDVLEDTMRFFPRRQAKHQMRRPRRDWRDTQIALLRP